MPELSPEQIEEIYQKLPEEIKTALFSEINALFIRQIAAKFHLPPEKIPDLAETTGDIMMGIIPLSEFRTALQENLNIDGQMAQAITQEVNFKIFTPIRLSLRKIHGIITPEEISMERLAPPAPVAAPKPAPPPIPTPVSKPISPPTAFVPPSGATEIKTTPMPSRSPVSAPAPSGFPSRPISPTPAPITPDQSVAPTKQIAPKPTIPPPPPTTAEPRPVLPPSPPKPFVPPRPITPKPFIPPRPITPPEIIVPKTITPPTSTYQRPAYESPALSQKTISPSLFAKNTEEKPIPIPHRPPITATTNPLSPPTPPSAPSRDTTLKPITPPSFLVKTTEDKPSAIASQTTRPIPPFEKKPSGNLTDNSAPLVSKSEISIPTEPIDLTKININDLKGNIVDLKNLERD